ncbi:MAG TPA: F0F1 ATP synthase subunit epsilon [Acidimicrobiia bacterium]|nr:F0F1 ATP synthase subunit epsilon [Acidimicrobiia bacterium]
MKLRVILPTRIGFEWAVDKVVAEGPDGFFGLLPRHVDTVGELVPGILSYTAGGQEGFLAVDGGTLVKLGSEVLVVTGSAVAGDDLEKLRTVVEESMQRSAHRDEASRSALARLEVDIVQRLVEMREGRRE